jgi:hypothetical protein
VPRGFGKTRTIEAFKALASAAVLRKRFTPWAIRSFNAEPMLWHFDTQIFARDTTFETGANLIPSAPEKATAVNEDHVLHSPNRQQCTELASTSYELL